MNQVEKIKKLVLSLPKKDITLANDLIIKRDIEALNELVKSAIIKVNRNTISQVKKEQYNDINLEDLNTLQLEIESYSVLVNIYEDDE